MTIDSVVKTADKILVVGETYEEYLESATITLTPDEEFAININDTGEGFAVFLKTQLERAIQEYAKRRDMEKADYLKPKI